MEVVFELMERLRSRERLDKVPIPADCFDLIGGTSTGGLIAILLGRLRLSAADAIKAYEALAGKVFSHKKAKGKDGTFKASNLEEAIKGVVRDTLGREHTDARMYEEGEGGSDRCRALVCAVGTSDVTHAAGPTLFRSYDVAKNKEYNCTIREAARETSAAPTFFKRIKIGPPGSEIEYVDAGIGCNNPVKQVIAEAARVFGEDAPIAGIVSIGTGQSGSVGFTKPDAFQNWLPINLIKVLKEIATDSGRVAEEMQQKYKNLPGLYNRLDVDRGLQSVSLDEWKRLGDVRAYTKNYMRLEVNDRRVDNVVGLLYGSFSHHTRTAGELVGFVDKVTHTTLRINVPQSRVSHFVDRQAMLKDTADLLSNRTSEEIVVLLGMGGSGKTQLALDFCRQAEEKFGFMAVIWINASSPVSVMQSYRTIAKKISKSQQDDANDEDVISLVQDTLRDWKHPWLLVFDNYDNPKAFQTSSIRRYIPSGKSRRVLFTSRHEDSARLGHKVEVSDMTENESLKVLLQRMPLNDEESFHGKEIAASLGYLALALDQAGSYLRARNLRLCDFISHYHKRKEVILKAIPDEWEYRRTIGDDEEKETNLRIFTTWELSFEQITGHEREIQQKEHFLSLAALFDATAISERYFEAYFNAKNPEWMAIFSSEGKWDSDKLGDLLAEFRKLSLLQLPNYAVDVHFFSIHPVVRDWIQVRKSRETRQQFAEEFITTLTSYLENVDNDSLSLETKQESLLHIDSCVGHNKWLLCGSSSFSLENRPDAASLFAHFYSDQGQYSEAEKLCEQALIVNEKKLGPMHRWTLHMVENLANVYSRQSRFDEAEKLYERVLDVEGKLGATHCDTHVAIGNLANVYVEKGRYDEAEKLLHRALIDGEENLGATHHDTLTVVRDLAQLYSLQSRYDEAEKLCERALTGDKEQLGATHPKTLSTMHVMAYAYAAQCQYDEAEKLYKEVLIVRKEKLGATHPDTLSAAQGRHDEAEKLYKETLIDSKEKLGATHPDTPSIKYNLANLYTLQGRYNEAKKLYKEASIDSKEESGATYSHLAVLYRKQGRYDEASKLDNDST